MADVGRPTVMTTEVLAKLESAFVLGCSDLEACLISEISPDALYDYQKANEGFTKRKEMLKKSPTLVARRTVVKAIETESDTALKYLERKEKDEFSTSSNINNTHTFTSMPSVKIDGKEHTFEVGEPVE